ncbi:MAG: hypothetical protein KatS3mg115_0470 [Candidatus Poribacteria bacterium]|nr:MAG: hypothetical protein KatS3mg115_0470 [Candidatus Poribacteria bacterium]
MNARGCFYTPYRVEISPYTVARVRGKTPVAERLLQAGALYDVHTAAYLGELDRLQELLDRDPAALERTLPQWHPVWHPYPEPLDDPHAAPYATPLCYAVAAGQFEAARLLIERGAEVRRHSWHLLNFAGDNEAIVRLLLEAGADPQKLNRPVVTDQEGVSRLLAEHGAPVDPNAPNRMGWPPIVYVCRGDRGEHPEKVRKLLAWGADVHATNRKGKTALHVAAKAGFLRSAEALLEGGAEINRPDPAGETPLFDAIRATLRRKDRKIAMIRFLLAHGADPTLANRRGETPLQVAERLRGPEREPILQLLRKAVRQAPASQK